MTIGYKIDALNNKVSVEVDFSLSGIVPNEGLNLNNLEEKVKETGIELIRDMVKYLNKQTDETVVVKEIK